MKLKFLISALVVFTFASNRVNAQSITTISSITARMNYTAVSDPNNVALIGGLEHYISTNSGATWTELNNDSGSGLYQMEGFAIAVQSSSVFCMVAKNTMSSVYYVLRTTDGGTTWTTVVNTSSSLALKDIAVHGNTFVVTAPNGIYRSTDAGATWTFITLSSANEVSNFVEYNNSGSSWVIGGYTSNLQVSTDDGLTWQELNLGFAPSTIQATTPTANGVMLSKSDAIGTQMILLGASNVADTATTISSGLVFQGTACKNAAFMPNNKLLTHNAYLFFSVDTSNQELYNIDTPAAGLYPFKAFSMGATYGVAFGTNSGNTQSKAYLINLSGTSVLSVPSQFTVAGPGPCAGDNIVATANADYANSYQWYVNNVLVSTTNTLNYPTPANTYGTYTVKLNTYYQSVLNTTTKSVVMTAPSPPGTYVATVDTSACYGLPLHVLVNPDGSPSNTGIKIVYNGEVVYGPTTLTGVNVNAYTDPVTVGGILQIITYKTLYCDPSADTLTKEITVGPNLFDFDLLPHDSVICVGVNPEFNFDGTLSQYNYDFFTSYSFGSWTSDHINVPGNSNGLLTVNQWGTDPFQNNSVAPETYGPMYMYVHLSVSDPTGCAPSKVIDTIRIQRSKAYFELHSRSFLQDDTVHLSNAYVTPNRLWSSEELTTQYLMNPTDTIPLIVADTVGFFGITLRNEPIAECVDSMTEYIHYANQAPEFDVACDVKKVYEKDRLHKVSIDQFGNIYEIRAYEVETYHYPRYILRKNDQYGNLIWEKRAPGNYTSYDGVRGVAMEEIDFDGEGNPIVGLWIQGSQSYQDDYINYTMPGVNLQGNVYLLKLNKDNGDLIWGSDLNALAPEAYLSTGVRVTDLVVDGDVVHASVYSSYNLDFFTLNTEDGSLVNTTPLELGTWGNYQFILPGFLYPDGSNGNASQSYWSPQIDVLSTGEVVAVGHYQTVTAPNYPQLDNFGAGMFILKYHPDQGVYDVEKLAQTGYNAFSPGPGYTGYNEIPRMFVDNNDNITVAGMWENSFWNGTPMEYRVLDSIFPMKSGSFVVNIDADYNINWLTKGTHANIEDMVYIPTTNETYLAVKTKDNYSLGSGNAHLRLGEERTYDFDYTHLPDWQYDWLDYVAQEGFLVKLNANGEPVEMKLIDHNSNDSVLNSVWMRIRMDGTACGDLAIYTENSNTTLIGIDNQTYVGDSVLLILQYSNCNSDDCSYLNAAPEMESCAVNGTIDVQLNDYFNLNSTTYSLVSGSTTYVSNQTTNVTNGQFSFPSPIANGTFDIIFSAPNADTMTVTVQSIVLSFGDVSEDTLCVYGAPVQLGTNASPSNGTYSGTGVSGFSFNPAVAGVGSHELTYAATDLSGCSGSINQIIVVDECLGLEDTETPVVVAYPNPFEDKLNVYCSKFSAESELIIKDNAGRIIYRQSIQNELSTITLSQLASGNYFLEITNKNNVEYREKLIHL